MRAATNAAFHSVAVSTVAAAGQAARVGGGAQQHLLPCAEKVAGATAVFNLSLPPFFTCPF